MSSVLVVDPLVIMRLKPGDDLLKHFSFKLALISSSATGNRFEDYFPAAHCTAIYCVVCGTVMRS